MNLDTMDPIYAKWITGVGWIALSIIRIVPEMRAATAHVAKTESGLMDRALFMLGKISPTPPLIWFFSSALSFADYSLHPVALIAGTLLVASGCWFLYRTHADLGRNFSYLLEIQENHQLVTTGIYRRIRHPLYSSVLLFAIGHALVVPNYIAGPSLALALVPLVAWRMGPEERMMTEEFGDEYTEYCRHTKRLIPGVY